MRQFLMISTATVFALVTTGCEEFGLGADIPIPGTDYCLGLGVSSDDGRVDWAGVELHECVPYGYFSCDYDVWFDGAFGGQTCQGDFPVADALSIHFQTSDQVTSATIEWQTDMMDTPSSATLYPVYDNGAFFWGFHLMDPGYTNDGDRVDFTIHLYNGADELQDPIVSVFLDGTEEDVRYDGDDREYTVSW